MLRLWMSPRRAVPACLGTAAMLLGLCAFTSARAASYDIERYLNIRSAAAAGLSDDARTVAFTTNITGTRQLWAVSARDGWPEQLTFFADPVSGVQWSPRGDWIAFAKDDGGDENFQLYLVSSHGRELVKLTDQPGVRHNLGRWSVDGRYLAYTSNQRDRKFFDLYVLDVETRQSRRILEDDANWGPGPFSRDGRRIVAVRSNASLDNDLFVLDVAAEVKGAPSEAAHLTPHQGLTQHRVLDWAADDRSLWLVSDGGRDFTGCARLDLATKQVSWIRTPSWDIGGGALSPDGRRLALVVNQDGYDKLHLLDTATLRDLPLPALPAGVVDGPVFSRDGRRLALTVGGAARPADVWLLDLEARAARQLTRSSTAGIPPSTFAEPRLVRYRTFDGREIPAFLYLPAGARSEGAPPCIVWPHGGPEGQTVARFSAVQQFFIHRGYAVFAPNVRGSTGYGREYTHLDDVRKREDSVKDLAAGVDWLKTSGMADPGKLAVMGGSYGGYMTLAAITLYPDLWAAAVDMYGIANFRTFFGNTASYRVGLRASEYGDPVRDAAFLDSISPIRRVDAIRAPLLVLQGAKDPRVPKEEAEQIVAAVRKKGGVAEFILFPEEGHGFTKLPDQITAYRAVAEFLDKYVRRAAAGSNIRP